MNCSAFMRVSEGKPTWSNLAYDRVDATLKKKNSTLGGCPSQPERMSLGS